MGDFEKGIKRVLIVEDGDEYEKFARLFLSEACELEVARSAAEALSALGSSRVDAFLFDLRFDRAEQDVLVGDLEGTARRLFAGDAQAAVCYLKKNQGVLILAELRRAGYLQPAVFVHEFAPERLENLKRLYGDVRAVESFDAVRIRRALGV